MFIDSRSLPDNHSIDTEVCIAGAGAAGITVARELAGMEFRVCLLESGGFDFDGATQSLCEGENIGLPYVPLEYTRFRYLGGTTNVWSGQCRPLDRIDFEKRDWIPYSGWPFSRSDLDPYYERAQLICRLGPFAYDAATWETSPAKRCLPFRGGKVVTSVFQFSPPTRFGEVYRDVLKASGNIECYLFANVVEIETNESARRVKRLVLSTLEGRSFSVSAKVFILAVGGIETPRLLLLSNRVMPSGLGNRNDLVGRFFMEHPHLESGVILLSDPDRKMDFDKRHRVHGTEIYGALAMREQALRDERIVGFSATLSTTKGERYEAANRSAGVESLKFLYGRMRRGEYVDEFWNHLGNVLSDIDDVATVIYGDAFKHELPVYRVFNRTEQAPNPESRVTLSETRDRLGMKRARLDWRLSVLEKRSMRRAHRIIARELGLSGLGRFRIELDESDETWPPELTGGCHHLGTTRMNDDPAMGVVDANCRVHGISNLFIAGPSVFPTSGYANPMLTIVALSIRLADHVKAFMT